MSALEDRSKDLRFRCHALGCDGSPYCEHCGTDLYDPDYLQHGYFTPLFSAWYRFRRLIEKRKYCGRDIEGVIGKCTLSKGHKGECDDIPF